MFSRKGSMVLVATTFAALCCVIGLVFGYVTQEHSIPAPQGVNGGGTM